MSCDDGLVMTLHPGVRRNHHTAHARAVRRRHRARHPGRGGVHRRAAAAARRATAPTRASTWCCSPSTRPCSPARSPRWPASTRPSTSGAPWWFLDAPDAIRRYRAAVTETAGLHPHLRLRRRHPRVLLDPGPPRHVAPARRGLPRPSSSPSTASTRTRRSRRRIDLVAANPKRGVQAVSADALTPRRAAPATAAPAAPVRIVHLGPRQLLPRPPGLVHRARPGRRRVGHRRVHRRRRRGRRARSPRRTGSTR